MEIVNIGLLGLGTVGGGVVKVLESNSDLIARKTGVKLKVTKALVRTLTKKRDAAGVSLTDNPEDILSDPQIHIVAELMGGLDPSFDYINKALDNGKNIVTANKELMASKGNDLLIKAEKMKRDLFFEASVAGGIPIVTPLKESLSGNKINRILGILNGTTNYILTKMESGCEFDEALEQAQEAGFAESDPSADLEGWDSAAKIGILASIAYGSRISRDAIYTEGITEITKSDIGYARDLGYVIKLIALAQEDDGALDIRVHPTMINIDHPLAAVKANYNAVFLEGDAVGDLMFFGQGAGSLPTASAVVGDLIKVARNIKAGATGTIGCTCFDNKKIKPISEVFSQYYMRMIVADKPGVLAKIAHIFGDNEVSISKVLQTKTGDGNAEVIFVTHKSKESNVMQALDQIRDVDVIKKVAAVIRSEVPADA